MNEKMVDRLKVAFIAEMDKEDRKGIIKLIDAVAELKRHDFDDGDIVDFVYVIGNLLDEEGCEGYGEAKQGVYDQ